MKVSLFMLVKEPAPHRAIAIASMKLQTRRLMCEIIIVDGDMEPDSGPNEALRKALSRCTGDIIGSCAADETLAPDAVERALGHFEDEEVSAITGDARLTNLGGAFQSLHKGAPFDLGAYLHCAQTPYWCSSFFRRSALPKIDPESESVEFDVWCHLALHGRIEYVPFAFANYAVHKGQASNNIDHMVSHLRGRIKRIRQIADEMGVDPMPFIESHKAAFIHHAEVWNLPTDRLACL